jgi:beta-aspartyl-peptidase (threonine type)
MRKIIVHGGAGDIRGDKGKYSKGVEEACTHGYEALKTGSPLDAVCEAVQCLEDNPIFNAGTGATLNISGFPECDAAIMKSDLSCGAVAALVNTKNPILVARKVMEETDHILLAGRGAEKFARYYFPEVDLRTEKGMNHWKKGKKKLMEGKDKHWKKMKAFIERTKLYDTVGAVAFDGEIAVATSTGGVLLKLEGRVGDTPLFGCGTYANRYGGASATGLGENIIRNMVTKNAVDMMRRKNAMNACMGAIKNSQDTGIIGIDFRGNVGYAKNTKNMSMAYYDKKVKSKV